MKTLRPYLLEDVIAHKGGGLAKLLHSNRLGPRPRCSRSASAPVASAVEPSSACGTPCNPAPLSWIDGLDIATRTFRTITFKRLLEALPAWLSGDTARWLAESFRAQQTSLRSAFYATDKQDANLENQEENAGKAKGKGKKKSQWHPSGQKQHGNKKPTRKKNRLGTIGESSRRARREPRATWWQY